MEQRLTLNDGTIFENSSAAENGNGLWLYINSDFSFADLFAIVNNPEKTKRIIAENMEGKKTFRGYKDLFYVRKGDGGSVSVGIRK